LDDKFDDEEVIDSKEILEDFAIRWLDARDDIDWQCWFLFRIKFELGLWGSQRFKSSRLKRSSESEVSSMSDGSVFTLSKRLSRVPMEPWSQPNRSQVLVWEKAEVSSMNDDVEESGEFEVDEASDDPEGFLLGSSFRYFSIS
jgi:hypothetical protein